MIQPLQRRVVTQHQQNCWMPTVCAVAPVALCSGIAAETGFSSPAAAARLVQDMLRRRATADTLQPGSWRGLGSVLAVEVNPRAALVCVRSGRGAECFSAMRLEDASLERKRGTTPCMGIGDVNVEGGKHLAGGATRHRESLAACRRRSHHADGAAAR